VASTGRLLPLLVSLLLAGSLFAADVASKSWAESELRRRGSRSLLGGRLLLRYQNNSGIAFGLFQRSLHPHKRAALIAYSSLVTVGLAGFLGVRLWRRRAQRDCLMPLGLVALLAGAAGNLRDRITRGAVIDFIDLQLPAGFTWPAFNLADVYLTIGLALCVAALVAAHRAPPTPEAG
jgi:signal peptidase II